MRWEGRRVGIKKLTLQNQITRAAFNDWRGSSVVFLYGDSTSLTKMFDPAIQPYKEINKDEEGYEEASLKR